MYYKLIKTLLKTTLALTIIVFSSKVSLAQGTVSLADDIDNEIGIDNNVPDEISLFGEENAANGGILQPAGKIETTKRTVETITTTTSSDVPSTESKTTTTTSTISLPEDDSEMLLEEYNNDNPLAQIKVAPAVVDDNFGEDLLKQVDDKIFSQMSDIEKQTSLLTLELRREKIKTEIEAIKNQRKKALEEEEALKEQKAREKAEWENEQQRKLIAEQVKLQEEAIVLERLRQEKVINTYKNEMLKTNQKWIEALNTAYSKTKEVENERSEYIQDFKVKMKNLSNMAQRISSTASMAKDNYQREIKNLQSQVAILNSRVDTLNREKTELVQSSSSINGTSVDNPFAPAIGIAVAPETSLSEEYNILEIKGKGEDLIAKISNKEGSEAFMVKKGTTLKSGYIIEEITPTHIRANRRGERDYIYFSAGGVLDREPEADSKIRSTPMGTGNGGESGTNSSTNKKAVVSDNFLDQMFAK